MAIYTAGQDCIVDGKYTEKGERITLDANAIPSKTWKPLDDEAWRAYKAMEEGVRKRASKETETEKLKKELEQLKGILVENAIIDKAKMKLSPVDEIEAKKAKAKANAETKAG